MHKNLLLCSPCCCAVLVVVAYVCPLSTTSVPVTHLLRQGIDRFDVRRGVKLATYCYYHILSCMIDLLCELGRPFQLPRSVVEKLAALDRVDDAFVEQRGRRASPAELQEALNLPAKALPRLLHVRGMVPVALEATNHDDGACLDNNVHACIMTGGIMTCNAVSCLRVRC